MKIRLKFRKDFQVYEVASPDVKILELLNAASNLFKIHLSNVRISLNANDYYGLSESDLAISALGVVNGDVVYVTSLEQLDDIKLSMENELLSAIADLCSSLKLAHPSPSVLIAIPTYWCNISKGLFFSRNLGDLLSSTGGIIRLKFLYYVNSGIHVTFTIFTTGNLVNIGVSTEELNLRNQLILRSRDYLVQSTVLNTNAPLDPKLVFRDLQTLCIRIKDELIEPILVDIHIALNLSPRLTLCTLPVDIIIRILLLLPLSALGKLVLCNWHLYRLIKNCAPIWRIQLAHLNAKRQPLLNAALTRQQKQQREQEQRRQQQQRDQDSPSGVANRIPCTATDNRTDEEPTACTPDPNCTNPQVTDEDSLSETQSVQSPLPYERFVARYRSLLVQRKCRGLSPSFV